MSAMAGITFSAIIASNLAFAKKSLEKISMSCPECGGTALYVCNCKYKDKQCGKGHVWYINSKKQIVKGDPHS